MVKQRDPIELERVSKEAKEEAFTSAAHKPKSAVGALKAKHNPSAVHGHTSVTIRLNQYEHELFKAASASDDRKLLDWMRRALTKAAEKQLT
jgi:hypothetical protein